MSAVSSQYTASVAGLTRHSFGSMPTKSKRKKKEKKIGTDNNERGVLCATGAEISRSGETNEHTQRERDKHTHTQTHT